MDFIVKKEQDLTVVSITGRMDAVTAPEAENKLMELIGSGEKKVIVDFQKLEYISSAGLRCILASVKKLKAKNGDMVFTGLQGHVMEVFKISGFYSLFRIFDTVDTALNELNKK